MKVPWQPQRYVPKSFPGSGIGAILIKLIHITPCAMLNGHSKLTGPCTFLILLFSVTAATACFWVTGTTYEGHRIRVDGDGAARRLRAYLKMDRHEDGLKMQRALVNSTN